MLNYLIIAVTTAILCLLMFICITMYMEYLIKRLSTTLTLNSKGIPATEKIRKQSLSSEHMRIKQNHKGVIK